MKDIILYRPYRSHQWFVPVTMGFAILAFVTVGYCLPDMELIALLFVALGIGSVWLTKVLYDTSHIVIFFEQEGLRMMGGKYKDYRYVRWEELPYAYYANSYKGHLFLVLSHEALSPKQAKIFANRGANSSRICVDSVVVIHLDALQNVEQLKEMIDNRVLNVVTD